MGYVSSPTSENGARAYDVIQPPSSDAVAGILLISVIVVIPPIGKERPTTASQDGG